MNRRFDPLFNKAAELLANAPLPTRGIAYTAKRAVNPVLSKMFVFMRLIGLVQHSAHLNSEHVTPLPLTRWRRADCPLSMRQCPTILEVLPTVGIWTESFTIGRSGWCLQLNWGQGLTLKG